VLYTLQNGKEVLEKIEQTNNPLERSLRAEQCLATLRLSLPAVIDREDNKVNIAYAGWPDRFVIVGLDGRIAYYGKQGPGGFKPSEAREWLEKNTRAKHAVSAPSPRQARPALIAPPVTRPKS
jgi:hypothetical protein